MAVRDCVTARRVAPQGNQAGREGIAHPSPADGVPPSGVTDLVLGSAPFACSRVRRLPVNAPLGTGQATVQLSLVNCQFGPRGCPVALSRHDLLRLLESLRSADGLELVREVTERLLQELIEAEATARIGAQWGERTDTRTTSRNGHREETVTTQAGDLELAIPKLRTGSFFPGLLERRRRIGQALYPVVMEAYVHGVSTRSVDGLVKALGSDTGNHVRRHATREAVRHRTPPGDHQAPHQRSSCAPKPGGTPQVIRTHPYDRGHTAMPDPEAPLPPRCRLTSRDEMVTSRPDGVPLMGTSCRLSAPVPLEPWGPPALSS